MKVVVQSSSLLFTVLSILFNVPITRVNRKPERSDDQLELTKPIQEAQPHTKSASTHA